jgi:hypothetical protein
LPPRGEFYRRSSNRLGGAGAVAAVGVQALKDNNRVSIKNKLSLIFWMDACSDSSLSKKFGTSLERAIWLSALMQITAAGQRRTLTGFAKAIAALPSLPRDQVLDTDCY